jgi:cytochrome P450
MPQARDPWLVTLMLRTLKNQIEGWPRAIYEADAWSAGIAGFPLWVMSPELVRKVLHEEAEHFPQGALFKRMMRPAWGEGMLIAEGKPWRFQRQAASKAFRPANMAALTPYFTRATEETLTRWKSTNGATLDVGKEMQRLTFDIILETVLSGAEHFDRETARRDIAELFAELARLELSYFLASDAYHETRPPKKPQARGRLMDGIARMIAKRRKEPARGDLVDLLMQARDPETGAELSDALLADNLLGFIMAGHETTATALTWSLYLAAAHPPTMQRLREEVAAVAGQGPIAPDHIDRLVFTRQVIQEATRLYPPAYQLTRVAARATTLGGHKVKPGDRILIPIYAIHRRANVFADPHAFNPDRFAPSEPQPDRFAFIPFGAGPRICVGAAFAMTEATVILATLARAADFTPPAPETVWPIAGLSLWPKGGMPMQVRVVV